MKRIALTFEHLQRAGRGSGWTGPIALAFAVTGYRAYVTSKRVLLYGRDAAPVHTLHLSPKLCDFVRNYSRMIGVLLRPTGLLVDIERGIVVAECESSRLDRR